MAATHGQVRVRTLFIFGQLEYLFFFMHSQEHPIQGIMVVRPSLIFRTPRLPTVGLQINYFELVAMISVRWSKDDRRFAEETLKYGGLYNTLVL